MAVTLYTQQYPTIDRRIVTSFLCGENAMAIIRERGMQFHVLGLWQDWIVEQIYQSVMYNTISG